MRIPSLGLVEGDIIALMAGDITPGKAIELLPEEVYRKNRLENIIKSKEELYKERELQLGLERGVEPGPSWSIRQSADSSSENFIRTINGNTSKTRIHGNKHSVSSNDINYDNMHTLNPIFTSRSNRHRNSKMLEKGTKIHLRVRYPDKNNEREKGNNRIINDITSVFSKENRSGKGNRKESRTYESTYRSKPYMNTKVRTCYKCVRSAFITCSYILYII